MKQGNLNNLSWQDSLNIRRDIWRRFLNTWEIYREHGTQCADYMQNTLCTKLKLTYARAFIYNKDIFFGALLGLSTFYFNSNSNFMEFQYLET